MARFGIDLPKIELTGELYQQQGVVDNSKATMINGIAEQVRPIATQVQSQLLANDLADIDDEFEQNLGPADEDRNNPAVTGFQAELQRLNQARARISEAQYEARKNAALKARINQTPGLADALNRTAAQFDKFNEYSLVNQAISAQKAAQGEYDDLVKYGVDKLGLPPTWTNDPRLVEYAETRSIQHAQAAANRDIMTNLDLITKEQGANEAIEKRLRELRGREAAGQLSGKFLDITTQGLNITLGDGEEAVTVNAMDASSVLNLNREQRVALARELKTQFLSEQVALVAQVNDGTLDADQVNAHVDNLKSLYNGMIAFTQLEDEALMVTQEDTVLSANNMALEREVTALDLQLRATDISYNMMELDRTRALEIQNKEVELVNKLVVAGAEASMLENPAVLRWKVMNGLGLVDAKSADAQLFIDQLAKGGIGNEREAALQVGNFSKWQKHMATQTGLYRRMRVDLVTPASAAVVAEDAQATINQVAVAVKSQVRPMDMDEVADVMNIFASDNYGAMVEQYSEQFGDVGVQMEQVIAPVIARDFITKATNLYAGQGINNIPLLTLVDGQFAIGNRPVSGALVKSDAPEARIVKGLNNTAKAIANTQNISLEEANKKVLSMIPMERMINLFERNIRGQSVGSEFPEMAGEVEGQVQSAIDNLYGDGAYLRFEVDQHVKAGYVEVGPAPNGKGTIYQRGSEMVVIGG